MTVKILSICTYCGYEEQFTGYVKPKSCSKCGDKNLKLKKLDTGNIFGYDEEELPDSYLYGYEQEGD